MKHKSASGANPVRQSRFPVSLFAVFWGTLLLMSGIHAPIGITIFAETPEEIAISIAAELIRCRAQLAGTEKARKG